MAKLVYGIEGIDRLGKSLLIDGIRQRAGYYEVIHFGKPSYLKAYMGARVSDLHPSVAPEAFLYQQESFRNSMLLTRSGARIIFDRWHLGECVYAPMYRAYSGDYVFEQEKAFELDRADVRLILLCEDFGVSHHFESDGDSFDDKKRYEEQQLFIKAFDRSIIRDKRMITVTHSSGRFRSADSILDEALA